MPMTTHCCAHGCSTNNDCIGIAISPAVQDGGCEHWDVGGAIQRLRERRGVRQQRQVMPVRLRRWVPQRALPVAAAGADGVPLGEAGSPQAALLQCEVRWH
jgi:hypothetical protein